MKLPKAKTNNIVVQNLTNETLIYDLTTDQAFCLNETSAKVFNACNGETTFAELKSIGTLTDDVIFLALDGLKKENLLAGEYASPFAGMNRREVIKRVGFASMIALPVISALVAPSAAAAASGSSCSNTDFTQGSCAAGQRCVNGRCAACLTADSPITTGSCCNAPNVQNICCSESCRCDSVGNPGRNTCI